MRRTFLVGLVALLAGLAPAVALASPGVTTGDVNMRAGPSTAYPKVTVLPRGSQVEIIGCLEGHSWCDVSDGYNRGWVSSRYLDAFYDQRRVYEPRRPRYSGPIITFRYGNYWDRHYRNRPWYRDRDRWDRYDWRRERWEDRRERWDDRRDRWDDRRDWHRDGFTALEDDHRAYEEDREREKAALERQREREQAALERQREREKAEADWRREREKAALEEERRAFEEDREREARRRERDREEERRVAEAERQRDDDDIRIICGDGFPCDAVPRPRRDDD